MYIDHLLIMKMNGIQVMSSMILVCCTTVNYTMRVYRYNDYFDQLSYQIASYILKS